MTTLDHSLGVPQFFGSHPMASPRKPWHSAKKNLDGTYTIVASYYQLKNAHQTNDGGDCLIQTYQGASGLAKFIGGVLGVLCGGHVMAYATGAFFANLVEANGQLGAFVLGMPFGVVIASLIGVQVAKLVMGRKVFLVQEKIKMKF